MAGKPKDYLSTATADYTDTQFDVVPQKVMFESVTFNQDAFAYDDASVSVITHSSEPIFIFRLSWDVLKQADAEKIFDFFADTAKGKGKARTFEFPHPRDSDVYIVQFWTDVSKGIRYLYSIREVELRVRGYKL